MTESNYLSLKIINRRFLRDEKIETGKVLFCSDTMETFFDHNTRSRICLGKTRSVDFEEELKAPNLNDVGEFVIVLQEGKIKYTNSELIRVDIRTRDQMVEILGGWDTFIPYNLVDNGRLIAPRTLASCVFTGEGVPIDELMDGIQEFIDDFTTEGIDASQISSGTIDYERLPKEARMDILPVPNAEARLSLTKEQIQNNDVVQEDDTGRMFFVIDDTKLGSESAFKEFTVGSIPWAAVINRPLSISLKNGAVGSVLLNTSASIESQKLVIPVVINVDYVENGILKKVNGGTGNQTGTAAFVERETNDNTMHIAGFNTNGKMIESNGITAKDGILYASGFKSNDTNTPTTLPNITTTNITINKNDGAKISSIDAVGKDGSKTNIIKYDNGVIFGDKNDSTKVYGNAIEIDAETKITNKIGINDILIITDQKVESKRPIITKDELIISSDGSTNAGTLGYKNMGSCVSYSPNNPNSNGLYPNMTKSVYSSSVNGTILSNENSTYAIRRNKGSGSIPNADNIIEIGNDDVKVNGNEYIGNDLSVFGTLKVKGHISGTVSQANNADKLDGRDGSEYMLKDGSNNTRPPIVIAENSPAGRDGCLWIKKSTGVAHYWTGSIWTPISNTWKT